MNIGFDPSGRAFRWQVGNSNIETSYAVLGCPPYTSPAGENDQDEMTIWDAPKAFRPQICTKTFSIARDAPVSATYTAELLSVERLWGDLVQGKDIWQSARLLVEALKSRCPADVKQQGLALAIPNCLNEDAQDALLRVLESRYRGVSLLWRPVAAMLYWLTQEDDARAAFGAHHGNNAVWILDLDSAGMEFTRLTWRRHAEDTEWIAPIRACATATERRSNPSYQVFNAAWGELFAGVSERDQLFCCQTAPEIQMALESQISIFDAWVCTKNRWRKVQVEKPHVLAHAWETCRQVLKNRNPQAAPQNNDVILVHGWLAQLDPQGITKNLGQLWPGRTIKILPVDSVAQGARIFAERRAVNLPTYYDTLPEYWIWTNHGKTQLVAPNQEVEPGRPWELQDAGVQDAFCINRHRDIFSLLVGRIPCDDPEHDYARRLRVGLFRLLPCELPLHFNVTVEAAKGNARFTVHPTDESRPFVLDGKQGTHSVTLTYARDPDDRAQGKETQAEPEHKGYLEAQPVIGRIHDDPANVEMLKLLVGHYYIPTNDLFNAVLAYRTDLSEGRDNKYIQNDIAIAALFRWGWKATPRQPTRGLFGTRSLPNHEIFDLTTQLSNLLWNSGCIPSDRGARNIWSNRNNYCHGNASLEYKEHIRNLLGTHQPFPSWAEAHGTGYVLGDKPDDMKLLVNYCVSAHFGDDSQASMFWWSCFRMLCWHNEVEVTPPVMSTYLETLAGYLPSAKLQVGYGDVPRKNALFSILFALRTREHYPDFLMDDNDPLRQRLLQIIDSGRLSGVSFPRTMVANMTEVPGDFSAYVTRFIQKQDTVADRELGASIATMQ